MDQTAPVHPLVSPWGRFGLHSYFIDSDEPAIVDTGITTSPETGMAPALEAIGRRIEDVKWIFLTHGHIDHMGGAHALWELTGRKAEVVLHGADAHLLRSRQEHVNLYLDVREQYLNDPNGAAKHTHVGEQAISGEMEPTVSLTGGERIDIGGATIVAHPLPGHTAGSVAYEIADQGDVFVGDAVQIHGAANFFPGYEDPDAYRASLLRLRDEVRPERLFLGHPYRRTDGEAYGVELDRARAHEAITESLEIEARVRAAAQRSIKAGLTMSDSPYAPFESAAIELHYTGDPTLDPSPFFTTLHGYRALFD